MYHILQDLTLKKIIIIKKTGYGCVVGVNKYITGKKCRLMLADTNTNKN